MNKLSAAFNINNALKAQVAAVSTVQNRLQILVAWLFVLIQLLQLFSCGQVIHALCSLMQGNQKLQPALLNADISEAAHVGPLDHLSCEGQAWVNEKLVCFAPDQTWKVKIVALFLVDQNGIIQTNKPLLPIYARARPCSGILTLITAQQSQHETPYSQQNMDFNVRPLWSDPSRCSTVSQYFFFQRGTEPTSPGLKENDRAPQSC